MTTWVSQKFLVGDYVVIDPMEYYGSSELGRVTCSCITTGKADERISVMMDDGTSYIVPGILIVISENEYNDRLTREVLND